MCAYFVNYSKNKNAHFVNCLREKTGMRGYVLSEKGIEKLENVTSENGLTQEQIALETCLTRATVSKAFQKNKNKPLNLRSLRRLFLGLSLALEEEDYIRADDPGTSTIKISMSDRDQIKEAAQSLETEADKAERNGNAAKAASLRKKAANLRRIADQ